MKPIDRAIRSLEAVFEFLGAIAMLVTVLIVTLDVVMRYFFRAPLQWSTDSLTLYFIPAFFFFGLSGAYTRGAHIAVDVLLNRLPLVLKAVCVLTGRVGGLVLFGLIFGYGVEHLIESYTKGETLPAWIQWPIWPSTLLVPIGCGLILLRIAQALAEDVVGLARDGVLPVRAHEEGFVE